MKTERAEPFGSARSPLPLQRCLSASARRRGRLFPEQPLPGRLDPVHDDDHDVVLLRLDGVPDRPFDCAQGSRENTIPPMKSRPTREVTPRKEHQEANPQSDSDTSAKPKYDSNRRTFIHPKTRKATTMNTAKIGGASKRGQNLVFLQLSAEVV
jgi:hypothetical protein